MSSHSRSSSELESAYVKDVLPAIIDDFIKDFTFADVQNVTKDVFSKEYSHAILSESFGKRQIWRLFWILTGNEQLATIFLERIKQWYPWLTKKAYQERDDPSKNTKLYLSSVRQLQSRFQKFSDFNVHRIDYFGQLHTALRKLKTSNFVVLIGELGLGKKWLAVDVCSDYQIMSTMGFMIYWIDVSKCNSREDDFRALQQFQMLLDDGEYSGKCLPLSEIDGIDNKILQLQQNIRSRLEEKSACLLVLANVQNTKLLRAFNLNCKTLIITKNKMVAQSFSRSVAKIIDLEHGLTESEGFELFEKVLHRKRKDIPCYIGDLCMQIDGHPCLLSIVAHHLRSIPKRDWINWMKNLTDLQKGNKFTTIVKASLNILQDSEEELYNMLVIFPHSTMIPLKSIAALWNKTERETHDILLKFNKYSLIKLEQMPDESTACVMMYIYNSYLKTNTEINLVDLHTKIVDFYQVEDNLREKVEGDLFPNDYYFFPYIGHHLRKSGKLHLFPKLFLDFRFLGQKLRVDGFPNTIGDLKYFESEITGNDLHRKLLLQKLIEFLPSIEDRLVLSKDTCLIQYALMSKGIIKDEAARQASAFPDKVWFIEKGHFHHSRQIVSLPSAPKRILLLDADTCLIALANNEILLLDISLGYNSGPIYLTGNRFAIIKMELILKERYVLTLDTGGNVKLWRTTDDSGRSVRRRGSDRTKVNQLNLTKSSKTWRRTCRQEIQGAIDLRSPITTFYIETMNHPYFGPDLHLACADGNIFIYTWNADAAQFERKKTPQQKVKMENPCQLFKLFHFYMALNSTGQMCLCNLRDGSTAGFSFKWTPIPGLVCIEKYGLYRGREMYVVMYFVYRDRVMCLTVPQQGADFLHGNLETLYEIDQNDMGNAMTCACLSQDRQYLVLGTEHGLIVLDTEHKSEVLRGHISERITCVNIYSIDDRVFKYIIICGSEHSQILNLFGLKQSAVNTITWSFQYSCSADAEEANGKNKPQLEPDVVLRGGKLFDIRYSDSVLLTAADSKNRIHQLCTSDAKSWFISTPVETSGHITAMAANSNLSFCAYENGDIFNITEGVFEPPFTDKRISYLQLVNANTLVASSKDAKQTIVLQVDDSGIKSVSNVIDIGVYRSFLSFESYLLLVDHHGGFKILDLVNNFEVLEDVDNLSALFNGQQILLGGCDLKNNYLFLATTGLAILIYHIHFVNGELKIGRHAGFEQHVTDEVTCFASSNDASLLAVGLKSGTILVFQKYRDVIKEIYRLHSHKRPINDLKFSRHTEILVSCSEQLCLWDVAYIQNNPFSTGSTTKRRSSRFSSDQSSVEEVTDQTDNLTLSNNSPWLNKRGNLHKPELLSCIKFGGNKAEMFFANDDFTQFNTIDNEGAYYHLCVYDTSQGAATNGLNGTYKNYDGFS